MKHKKLAVKAGGGVLTILGFLLSPLSWWNDLIVNFPLSYLIALPFGWLDRSFFLPVFIGAYWFTNILGLFLMQKGCENMLCAEERIDFKIQLRKTLVWGSVYTVFIVVLVLFGVLKFPDEFIEKIVQ